jgi:H+/gluconate symporter-like permease
MREHAQGRGFDIAELPEHPPEPENLPSFMLALAPVIVVILANFTFIELVLPRLDTSYLAEPGFGETTIESVRGVWAVIVGLTLAILLLIAGNWNRLSDLRASLDQGTDASVLPIFNTASLVGFGAVIAALPVFDLISEAVLAVSGGQPLVSVAAAVTVLSAITGSASGGMSIALDSLGGTFVDLANAAGVSLEAMHRVTAVASGALDALPHNGAVITLLAVCGISHREAYIDVFMVALVGQLVSLMAIILLAMLFGSF